MRTPRRFPALPARPLAAARGALARLLRGVGGFAARVYRKAGQDDIFFLAGGIAFNILLGAIPFLLLLISIFGYVLQFTVPNPREAAVDYVFQAVPAARELTSTVHRLVTQVVDTVLAERTSLGIFGVVLLVWVSTRLVGSLRSAMRDIFDIQEDRGIIAGKIFDIKMVVVAGSLFVANTGITVVLEAAQTYGIHLLGLGTNPAVARLQAISAQLLAFAFIFLMFVLMYRYLPARRIPWRIAVAAAAFTGVAFELLKSFFAWYVSNLANYSATYGTLGAVVGLVFWIYYSAVVFVLGGEVGQVYELYRIRRRQRELLD